jgi:hypothetical protein
MRLSGFSRKRFSRTVVENLISVAAAIKKAF